MKKNYYIEQKINETLKSAEGISQAEPSPFYYARLKARMERELLYPKTILGFQLKPIYAYSVIIALVIINTLAISNFNNNQKQLSQEDSYILYQAE
jgi:hypothetical protein